MSPTKRLWNFVPEDQLPACLDQIIHFFGNERDEEIGMIAAGEILDFFQEVIGPRIYNAGVKDAKNVFQERSEDIGVDFDLLLRD